MHRKYVVTRMCTKIHNVCPLNFGTNLKLRRFSKVSCKKGQIPAGPFKIRTSFRIWGQTKILPLTHIDRRDPGRTLAEICLLIPRYSRQAQVGTLELWFYVKNRLSPQNPSWRDPKTIKKQKLQ